MRSPTPAALCLGLIVGLGGAGMATVPHAAQAQGYDRGGPVAAPSTADVQRSLAAAGYRPGPVDGLMGPSTRQAISAYQRDHGLADTGSVTDALVASLQRQGYLAGPAPQTTASTSPPPPDRRDRAFEKRLSAAGYDPGPVDGVIDWRTRQAVRALQADAGLQQTGQADRQTRLALDRRTETAARQRQGDYRSEQQALVEDVQLALRRNGYDSVSVTGQVDASTRAAIRAFQRSQSLDATGRPSQDLLELMEARADQGGTGQGGTGKGDDDWSQPTRTAVDEDPTKMVEEAEIRLRNKGYQVGRIDGTVDTTTEQAIRQYQEQRGMRVTGEVDRELVADLRTSSVEAPQQAADPVQQIFRFLGRQATEGMNGNDGK